MTPPEWIGIGTAVAGAGLAAFGAAEGMSRRRRETEGRQVPATVVEFAQVRMLRDPNTLLAPVFEFVSEDGRKVRKQSRNASAPPAHAIGDTVMVWYDPAQPEQADIVGEAGAWVLGSICLGLLFVAVGIAVFVFA